MNGLPILMDFETGRWDSVSNRAKNQNNPRDLIFFKSTQAPRAIKNLHHANNDSSRTVGSGCPPSKAPCQFANRDILL